MYIYMYMYIYIYRDRESHIYMHLIHISFYIYVSELCYSMLYDSMDPPPRILLGKLPSTLPAPGQSNPEVGYMVPGQPVACNYELLWLIYGLLWGMVWWPVPLGYLAFQVYSTWYMGVSKNQPNVETKWCCYKDTHHNLNGAPPNVYLERQVA